MNFGRFSCWFWRFFRVFRQRKMRKWTWFLCILWVFIQKFKNQSIIPNLSNFQIWRHGDRSQDGHLKNDPVDPSKWIKGGGGYGQLTPVRHFTTKCTESLNVQEGMEQQYILGKKLKSRYIETGFLHGFYDSQQVATGSLIILSIDNDSPDLYSLNRRQSHNKLGICQHVGNVFGWRKTGWVRSCHCPRDTLAQRPP